MTTTDKGTIQIEFDDNNQPKVVFTPVNGNIWLHKSKLVPLFEISIQTIHACIEAIYKILLEVTI